MISFDEAVELMSSTVQPLPIETVPIAAAARRVLAEPVIARIDSPRADVSAMDGYAVREEDLASFPAQLRVIGEAFAGGGWHGVLEPGTCARLFTGAPVPIGANRVVIQENVRREGDLAIIEDERGTARHIRQRGSDFGAGEQLLPARRMLDPRALVAAAAADVAELCVFARPRVHILSTGDELAEPGTAADRADAIAESVSFGVAALAEQWGAELVGKTRLQDDLESMQLAATVAVEDADVVVVTGGASVGERDFAKAMFEPLALQLVFSRVAIKPGKPVWVARARDRLIVGLPGNPTSALVTARLFLAPLLCLLQGRATEAALVWSRVPLGTPLPACRGRETFHRAAVRCGAADVLSFQDSSAQKALAEADVLVRQRADSPAIRVGEHVEVLSF